MLGGAGAADWAVMEGGTVSRGGHRWLSHGDSPNPNLGLPRGKVYGTASYNFYIDAMFWKRQVM